MKLWALSRSLFALAGSICLFWLALTSPVQAQIVEDATLPNSSKVTSDDDINVISGGTRAGANLFHSFETFSVPTGEVASFQEIDPGIRNIVSRVTGTAISQIDGLIEVLQANGNLSSANFFLLNPNGIIFGSDAWLNIGGSFIASTASSLKFSDGNIFSAANSQTTKPLLTVSVPVGLQFEKPAASILQKSLLTVPPGRTLGLLGGDLSLVEAGLQAEEGRIELGSVAGVVIPEQKPIEISLTPIGKGWSLGYEGVQNFRDIKLSQDTIGDASGDGGGDIQVQGRHVTLTGGSQIFAETKGAGIGGTLAVTASESLEINGTSPYGPSGLFANVAKTATGTGGDLNITTKRLTVRDGALVSTNSDGSGKAGNLSVWAENLVQVSGADAEKFGSSLRAIGTIGDGGNLKIETGKLIVRDGAQILASTYGQGKAGNLTVTALDLIELDGGVVATDGKFFPSGLLAQAEPGSKGTGGNLKIATDKLVLRNGAQISATTFGSERAGDLFVAATDIELFGAATSASGETLTNNTNLPLGSGLFAGTGNNSTGNGGNLTVKAERLRLRDGGVVQTTTFGAGNAGKLIVRASELVELIGKDQAGLYPSGLFGVSGGIPGLTGIEKATGRGGDIDIETGELIIQDGAAVAVSSLNRTSDAKGAGNLEITAKTIRLDNQGSLTSQTNSAQGGNITVRSPDLLLLRRNSQISATAGISGTSGDGGNITIDTPLIVAVPRENSDITANAFTGNGGNIRIQAQGIFGLRSRPQLTQFSDITASSEFGIDGVVEINTPNVDPSQGLVPLPTDLVDASGLIASGCGASRQGQSEFIVTGRGGLPPSPSDTISSDTIWSDLRYQSQTAENPMPAENFTQSDRSTTEQLVEAQAWLTNKQGEVVLSAQATTATPQNNWQSAATCSSK